MLSNLQKQLEEQQIEMGRLREAGALAKDVATRVHTRLFKQVDILQVSPNW